MPHKVEISDKTYEDLKEFCNLNDLKIGQLADKLIREGLIIEMYGDVPFTNYHIKLPQEIKTIEVKGTLNKDGIFEQEGVKPIDEETKAQMIETMEKVEAEHPQTYITNPEGEKEIQKEMLKQLGVPDKVVSKITRRRLK
jgi:DNA topoisomerase VI subunit B